MSRNSRAKLRRFGWVLSVALILTSCAGTQFQKRPMEAELRRSLSSVAIIQPKSPNEYTVVGAADVPGGFLLYAFGAIGGAVLGGVIADRMQQQADSLTSVVRSTALDVGTLLGETLKSEFERRGVSARIIPEPPRVADGKTFDYASVSVTEQVIVEPVFAGVGYRLVGGALRPMMVARVRVLDGSTKQEKFLDLFVYGDRFNDKFVTIAPKVGDEFADVDVLLANGEKAVNGLRDAAVALAVRAVASIKE